MCNFYTQAPLTLHNASNYFLHTDLCKPWTQVGGDERGACEKDDLLATLVNASPGHPTTTPLRPILLVSDYEDVRTRNVRELADETRVAGLIGRLQALLRRRKKKYDINTAKYSRLR